MTKFISDLSSSLATVVRAGLGTKVLDNVQSFARPQQMLTLFTKESCPFSRRVRETMSMLDIDAIIKPCPKMGTRYRPVLKSLGGKEQVPYLMDPNHENANMYESDRIVKYLFNEYGPGEDKIPPLLVTSTSPLSTFSSKLATTLRPLPYHGLVAVNSKCPNLPLTLYGFEGCPQSRKVREALDSLELSYVVYNVAPGTLKQKQFAEATKGHCDTPFLIDDNTNARLFDSDAIVNYLYHTYKL